MIPENSADQVWVTSPGCLPLGLGLGSFFNSAKIWSQLVICQAPHAVATACPAWGWSLLGEPCQSAGQLKQNLRLLSERGPDGWAETAVWLVTGRGE